MVQFLSSHLNCLDMHSHSHLGGGGGAGVDCCLLLTGSVMGTLHPGDLKQLLNYCQIIYNLHSFLCSYVLDLWSISYDG